MNNAAGNIFYTFLTHANIWAYFGCTYIGINSCITELAYTVDAVTQPASQLQDPFPRGWKGCYPATLSCQSSLCMCLSWKELLWSGAHMLPELPCIHSMTGWYVQKGDMKAPSPLPLVISLKGHPRFRVPQGSEEAFVEATSQPSFSLCPTLLPPLPQRALPACSSPSQDQFLGHSTCNVLFLLS